jgi:hypothetical protein
MSLTKEQRRELFARFDGHCAYCGCKLPERGWQADHVEPVQRKYKYVRDEKLGHGKLVPTGEFWAPERDTFENQMPCCRPCNIHKGPYSLEDWRAILSDLVGILRRNYPTFRCAERFGAVSVPEPVPIVFYFEKVQAEQAVEEAERE